MAFFRSLFPFSLVLGLFFFSQLTLAQTIQNFVIEKGKQQHTIDLSDLPQDCSLQFLSLHTFDKQTSISGFYRTATASFTSEWLPLLAFHDGPLFDRQVFVPGDIPVGTIKIDFQFVSPLPKAMHVRHFALGQTVAANTTNLPETTCSCSQPSFCARSCWCPSGNCDPVSPAVNITPSHVIVHHSAGNNNSTNWPGIVQAIWDFHVNTNGWDDVGYNWLIDPEGVIYEGRGSGKRGAHFSCMNGASTGICLIGTYSNTLPTPLANKSLSEFLVWETCDKGIAPGGISMHQPSQQFLPSISGHRDGNSSPASASCASGTVCPGDSLYALLPEISLVVAGNPCFFGGFQESVVLSAAAINADTYLAGEQLDFYGQQTYLGFADSLREFAVEVLLAEDSLLGNAIVLLRDTALLDSANRQHVFSGSYVLPTNLGHGVYYLHVTADADTVLPISIRRNEIIPIVVTGTVSRDEIIENRSIRVFPNPATDVLAIEATTKIAKIELFNMNGQTIKIRTVNGNQLDVSQLSPGGYVVEVTTQNGLVSRQVITVQR